MCCCSPENTTFLFIRILFFCSCLSFLSLSQVRSEPDSIRYLLANVDHGSIEKWEILAPFLSRGADEWDTSYLHYADSLIQLAREHFPQKLA